MTNFNRPIHLYKFTITLFAIFFLSTTIVPTVLASNSRIDLADAVILVPEKLSQVESNAIDLLLDEVEKRTLIRWKTVNTWPNDPVPVIAIAQAESIQTIAQTIGECPRRPQTTHPRRGRLSNSHPIQQWCAVIDCRRS